MDVTLWGHVCRPWGYEIRVDFKDGDKVYNEVLTFSKEPDEKELGISVEALKSKVIARNSAMLTEAGAKTENEILIEKVAKLESEKSALLVENAALKFQITVEGVK